LKTAISNVEIIKTKNGVDWTDEAKMRLAYLKTAARFPLAYKTLTLKQFEFATANKHRLVAAKWVRQIKGTPGLSDCRSAQDFSRMLTWGVPEEAIFMEESRRKLNDAISFVGLQLDGAVDQTISFEAIQLAGVAIRMEKLLDESCNARSVRCQVKRNQPINSMVVSKLRAELKQHGFELKSGGRVGTGKERFVESYNIQMDEIIKILLPGFIMDMTEVQETELTSKLRGRKRKRNELQAGRCR
jgi:hypothetical protein